MFRVPVGRTRILILVSFQISNPFSCGFFFNWTFFVDMMSCLLCSLLSTVDSIMQYSNIIIRCHNWINVVKLCIPLSKLDLLMLRNGSRAERTLRNKRIIWNSLGFEARSRRCSTNYVSGASGQNPNINPYKLSNLKFIPSLSFLNVHFFYRHDVLLIVFITVHSWFHYAI